MPKPKRDKVYHLRNQTYTAEGYTYVWAENPEDAMEQIKLGHGIVDMKDGFDNPKPTSREDLYEWDMKSKTHRKV